MTFKTIQQELVKNYLSMQNSEKTASELAQKLSAQQLADFVVDAFNRGWITPENLGFDEEGQIL